MQAAGSGRLNCPCPADAGVWRLWRAGRCRLLRLCLHAASRRSRRRWLIGRVASDGAGLCCRQPCSAAAAPTYAATAAATAATAAASEGGATCASAGGVRAATEHAAGRWRRPHLRWRNQAHSRACESPQPLPLASGRTRRCARAPRACRPAPGNGASRRWRAWSLARPADQGRPRLAGQGTGVGKLEKPKGAAWAGCWRGTACCAVSFQAVQRLESEA